ncbi:MAG: glycoside hydrolase family 3 C-terminal domain-containing protein [Bacteroidales bacterium]|nr:glycoside hydrolase family 3 C-terminal domain-containing protein [Candidatus Cryptobacteroides caccocaballi]
MKKRSVLRAGVAISAALALAASVAFVPADKKVTKTTPIYLNTNYSFEERAVDLVSRLTLEEKESLLGNNMAAVPRLGVKQYNVWSEALHGVLSGANPSVGLQGPTSFPGSVALGSSWDPELLELEASVIADEARAIFQTGTKGLTFWSPVVEPIRDPRWGRTGESYGEDPFLAATMSSGFVRGLMGPDETYMKAVPTAKHYFANNSEFDRHVSSSNMDSRDMREFYLYPYKELIENDNLPSIMSSYNAVNHVPTSASELYLDTIARRTYGMKGYVTGDCAAIEDIYTGHYYVETAEEATAAGLKAGVDSDCGSVYQRFAISALEKGLITMADIDRALVNMFTVRMRTGEFDPQSMVPYTKYPASVVNSERSQAIAEEVATRTPVLLKNTVPAGFANKALPLDAAAIKSIALIGPQADDVELGPYSGRPEESSKTTPYQGFTKYIADKGLDIDLTLASGGSTKSKSNLLYVAYFELSKPDGTVTRQDATQYSFSSEGITVGSGMGDEEQVRSIDDGSWTAYENIDLVNVEQITIGLNIPTEGGIVEVRVGSPEGNLISTIEATKASGKRVGGVYGASMPLEAKVNKLGYNGPQTLYLVYKAPEDEEIDPAVIKAAKESDVAIVFVGTDENTATEEADRLTLLLPGNQVKLIKAVAEVNKNTVVVMQTLGCVEVEEFKDLANVSAILWTGYNGQAQGAAIPKVLFGDVTPGGKLNATWYKSVNDLPAITDYTLRANDGKNGRTLWYFTKPVSYEFGYGISYTTFEYSNFEISKSAITPDDKITISVDVTNTGSYDGDEVVQIYMTTPDSPASLQRPFKRLKGFQRVTIPVGQTKTVDIDIDCADLWFWDMDKDCITYDSGRYVFEVGSSSKDIRGTVTATMNGKSFKPELKVVVADCGVSVMRAGQTAQTKVTGSLTDDSFTDITKAKVRYISSNPNVASVDANGLVTAKSMGVATITAKVTVDGKTVSGSYAIKVNPELALATLTVDGKSILKSGMNQYSIVRKASAKAPVVKATAKDSKLEVVVKQADEVPGTAIVKVIDNVTCDESEYAVCFGVKGVSDDFNGAALGKAWNVVRKNASALSVKNGALNITTAKGDLTLANNNAENLVLQSANSDWTIETKLSTSATPGNPGQNAGLVAYEDDDNFVKLVYANMSFGRGMRMPEAGAPATGSVQLVAEDNGNNKTTVAVNLESAADVIYLRLVKKGVNYTASYSLDGKTYTKLGETEVLLKDILAGVMATDGVRNAAAMRMPRGMTGMNMEDAASITASFDSFKITNSLK